MAADPALAARSAAALARAVELILKAQDRARSARDHAGGWRYQPTSRDSDLSVTGWQVMALRAAKAAGCAVPAETIDRAVDYIKRCAVPRTAAASATSPAAARTTRGPAPASSRWRSAASTSPPRPSPAPSTCSSTRPRWSSDYFFYEVYYCPPGHVPGRRQVLPRLLPQARRRSSWTTRTRTGAGSPATATTAPAAALLHGDGRPGPGGRVSLSADLSAPSHRTISLTRRRGPP